MWKGQALIDHCCFRSHPCVQWGGQLPQIGERFPDGRRGEIEGSVACRGYQAESAPFFVPSLA